MFYQKSMINQLSLLFFAMDFEEFISIYRKELLFVTKKFDSKPLRNEADRIKENFDWAKKIDIHEKYESFESLEIKTTLILTKKRKTIRRREVNVPRKNPYMPLYNEYLHQMFSSTEDFGKIDHEKKLIRLNILGKDVTIYIRKEKDKILKDFDSIESNFDRLGFLIDHLENSDFLNCAYK